MILFTYTERKGVIISFHSIIYSSVRERESSVSVVWEYPGSSVRAKCQVSELEDQSTERGMISLSQ